MTSKKAISEVIATVLIILITVSAVALIWMVIIPLVTNEIGGSRECMLAQGDLKIGTGAFTCLKENGTISLMISRGSAEYTLAGIGVSVYVGGTAFPENIGSDFPAQNQDRVFFITNHSRNLAYTDATQVEIYPILLLGKISKVCGKAQSAVLVKCIQ
jgi:flagellin-like protein